MQNLSNLSVTYLPEPTINVLATSPAFERDYAVDTTPYLKSGRNNFVPAATTPTAEQLQKRKEQMDVLKRPEAKTEKKVEIKTEPVSTGGNIASLLIDTETKSRTSKPKDKE